MPSKAGIMDITMTVEDELMERIKRAFPLQPDAPDLTTDAFWCLCETLGLPKDSELIEVLIVANIRLRRQMQAKE
jgi:hypothetical protein